MEEIKRRLTYLMLFRVGVVTLLLMAVAAAELGGPFEQPNSPVLGGIIGFIVAAMYLPMYSILQKIG